MLYVAQLDMGQVGALIKLMQGRVLLSAGSRPYLSVKLQGRQPLEALSEVLAAMEEAGGPVDRAEGK